MEAHMKVNGKMVKWMDMESYSIQMEKLHIKVIGLKIYSMELGEFTMKFKTNKPATYLLIIQTCAIFKTNGSTSKESLKMMRDLAKG
jgi:hypothetical protein